MTKIEKNAEKFAKNTVKLEQRLGRDLRPDEVMLLAMFASVVNASEEDDEKKEENEHSPSRAAHKLNDIAAEGLANGIKDGSKPMPWEQAADLAISLAFLGAALRIDQESKSKKESKWTKVKEFRKQKQMSECCCDKCDHKEEKKMNDDKSITRFKELDDALNSIPSDELDKMLKAESEKRKSSSNHEFSDAIAEAALEICGIDLKKEDET